MTAKINGTVSLATHGKHHRVPATLFGAAAQSGDEPEKMHTMFFDETLVSFFRRLAFSPDGSLLFLPTGLVPSRSEEGRGRHGFFVCTRGQLSSTPGVVIDGFARGVIAIRPHPRLFKTKPGSTPLFSLPYRVVYATASQDVVSIFDSTQTSPIAMFTGLHYGTLTDIAWSPDGQHLIVTATDGFASLIHLDGCLGEMMETEEQTSLMASLRERYAPGAIPKPQSQTNPLELHLNLNSEPPFPSEVDSTAAPSSPATTNAAPVINILPVKRKVVPTPLAE